MRQLRRAAGLLALAVLPLLAACGGGSSFPEPAACQPTTPMPTTSPGRTSIRAYTNALDSGTDRLFSLRNTFRLAYPNGTFYRRSEFRTEYAEYADETICLARNLRDLTPPNPDFEAFDARANSALDAVIAHTEAGRDAVRRRNVSDYRDWDRGVDPLLEALRQAIAR